VQYIQPQHHERLAQAELLVIDEAAAIPLPVVRRLLGPYLIFLCSTVNGRAPAPPPACGRRAPGCHLRRAAWGKPGDVATRPALLQLLRGVALRRACACRPAFEAALHVSRQRALAGAAAHGRGQLADVMPGERLRGRWRGRYEGTGRSLSLKLLQQLRAEGAKLASGEGRDGAAASGRTFREVQLQEPIRCAPWGLRWRLHALPWPVKSCCRDPQ